MSQSELMTLLVVGALIIVAILVWAVLRRRHTDHLRERFGDEYDRTLENADNRHKAEADLDRRERRVAEFDIAPLTPADRDRFTTEWREVKSVFVDSPAEAILHADRLIGEIMRKRGYPVTDFDQRYEDLTVDHATVANHYREGHAIAERHNSGDASTEDMRQAMIHYEALFDELVSDVAEDRAEDRETRREPV